MKSKIVHILAAVLLALAAAGCVAPQVLAPGTAITDYDSLMDALRVAGLTPESLGAVEQPFFTVPGQVLSLGGDQLQIYEYATRALAESEAALVSRDGLTIDGVPAGWTDAVSLYQVGRMIVVYLGEDQEALASLNRVLGTRFAGSDAPLGAR